MEVIDGERQGRGGGGGRCWELVFMVQTTGSDVE